MGSNWMQQWLLQYQNFPIYLKFSNFRAMVYSLRVFIHTFHLIMIILWEMNLKHFPGDSLCPFLSRPVTLHMDFSVCLTSSFYYCDWPVGLVGFGCERSQVWLPDRPLLPMIACKLLFLHWVKGIGKTIWKDYSKNVYVSNPFFKFVLNHIQLIQLLIATVKTYRNVLSCFLVRTYTNF